MLIARYPKRITKKTEVDPDKPVFTVAEVGTLLGCSRWTVIRIFENEPGVLILLRPEKMHKRSRRMIRIPRHVFGGSRPGWRLSFCVDFVSVQRKVGNYCTKLK